MSKCEHERIFAICLGEQPLGKKICVAGWIVDFSDIGKIGFAKVRDVTGTVQGVVTGDVLARTREIPRQSSVLIKGIVSKTKAKNLPVEIAVDDVIVNGKAVHPLPIDPTGRIESSMDKRLDCRALDLRNEHVLTIFKIRSEAVNVIRNVLRSKMFIEVNTPKIIGSATEGGANLFELDYFKRKAYLAQSPQLYKEQLTLGLERVFEVGPYFRAEPSHTVRHLSEFISIDLEAAYLDYNEIMDIADELIMSTIESLRTLFPVNIKSTNYYYGNSIESGIPRLSYEECLNELNQSGVHLEFGDDLSDAALRTLGTIHNGFYFIKDWPTKLKPFYIQEHERRKDLSKSFDLQFGYLELISGGTREHDPNNLRNKLMEQGLSTESFSHHLRAFDWGMPPHSGCGIGFDRLMMVLTSSDNIREVVLFPRDSDRLTP